MSEVKSELTDGSNEFYLFIFSFFGHKGFREKLALTWACDLLMTNFLICLLLNLTTCSYDILRYMVSRRDRLQ